MATDSAAVEPSSLGVHTEFDESLHRGPTKSTDSFEGYEGQQRSDPTKIGRYTVLKRLGQGSMGVVYTAYDAELDRKIALKLLRVEHSNKGSRGRARMLREAKALARLSHPNVIHVYEVGEFENQVFVAMEFVRGRTLTEWLREEDRTWREIVAAFSQAGAGLAAAHDAGLIHRDFKPDNVLVGVDGRVRVLDFGLARPTDRDEDTLSSDEEDPVVPGKPVVELTHAGALIGTPAYMSPEQIEGESAEARSDQFSFCVTLYEALYGERPFIGTNRATLMVNIVETRFAPLSRAQLRPIPGWLRQRVVRGLSRDVERRYPSMHELLEALGQDPWARRRRLYLSAAGIVLAGGLTGGFYVTEEERQVECQGVEERLAGVWDPATRTEVQSAFERVRKPFAPEAWQRTESLLNRYARAWTDSEVGLCEAQQRGDRSDDLLERRELCLDRRLQELGHLTSVLSEANEGIVESAVIAARSLPPVAQCANMDHLMSADWVASGRVRQQLEIFEGRLAGAKAKLHAGQYESGIEAANRTLEHARRIGHGPSEARSLTVLGQLNHKAGYLNEAEGLLHEAARTAEKAGADGLRARAIIALVAVIGDRGLRPEQGREWALHARAVLERVGDDPASAATLEANLGDVLFREGKLDEALSQYGRSLRMLEGVLGAGDPAVADVLTKTALVHTSRANHEQALRYHHDALAVRKSALGAHHPDVITSLGLVSSTLEALGRLTEAAELADQVLAFRETLTSDPAELAAPRFALARVLWPSQRARAFDLLDLARTGFAGAADGSAELDRLEQWIADQPIDDVDE